MDQQNVYQTPQGQLVEENTVYQPKVFATKGRIGRLRYLAYSMLVSLLVALAGAIFVGVGAAISHSSAMAFVTLIPIYLIAFAASIVFCKRRLNDLDQSGWLALLMLVPLINAIFGLYLMFAPGSKDGNKYGAPPAPNSRGVILAAWLAIFVPVIGIVAAVAIPAYQQYTLRAQAAQFH